MNHRQRMKLLTVMVVLVVSGVTGWLLLDFSKNQQLAQQDRLRHVASLELRQTEQLLSTYIANLTSWLQPLLLNHQLSHEALRTTSRTHPYVRQLFLVNVAGELQFPIRQPTMSNVDLAFLQRTAMLWERGEWLMAIDGPQQEQSYQGEANSGWFNWFANNQQTPIFWIRRGEYIVGAELIVPRLLADVINLLPDASYEFNSQLIRLVSMQNTVLYQWGDAEQARTNLPLIEAPVSHPLSSWRLQFYGAPTGLASPEISVWILIIAYLCFVTSLVIAGSYLMALFKRAETIAQQRVTFVNQVSHELKTPLTNIQLYGDLLEDELADDAERGQRYLHTIKQETARLARLIDNVLNLARYDNQKLTAQKKQVNLRQLIVGIQHAFTPLLAQKHMQLIVNCEVDGLVFVDPDMVSQIIANLLSNAEKYAGQGTVNIDCAIVENDVQIAVIDEGEGIPNATAKRIFDPFYRESNKLTDGVTGTGIGLSIARSLAECQGGTLTLQANKRGAHFLLILPLEDAR